MESNCGIPAPKENEYKEVAWAQPSKEGKFVPVWIPRHNVGEMDVKFEVLFCGICHSDCTMGRDNPMGMVSYPFVPGHEFIGRVTEVGAKVTKVKAGDVVGVGCYVEACLNCSSCKNDEESYCDNKTISIGAKKIHGQAGNPDLPTMGGYSGSHVVHEHFAVKIPEGMDLTKVAPILCGGITMFDPLKHWGALDGKKMTIGIVGIGGLGTMGIKLAKAMGHDVVGISRGPAKEAMCKEKGCDFYVDSKDKDSIAKCAEKCDLILNTVSASHDLNVYLPLLAHNGTIVQMGIALTPHPIMQHTLMRKRKSISGSVVGGLKATQEVVDFCHKHNILPDCQTITAKDIDWAWDRLMSPEGNAEGIRYVIDVKASLADKDFIPQ